MDKSKIDAAIYKTIVECADRFSSLKMMHILCYNMFGEWPYSTYDITADFVSDSARPYNESPLDGHDDGNIDYDIFHKRITELGYIRCELDYDDVYVNVESQSICLLTNSYVHCVLANDKNKDEIIDKIQFCIINRDTEDDKVEVGILVNRNGNFMVDDTEIDRMNIDVNKTYNDDLPSEAISEFVENEKNGLALFYGEPGTGKSTYIRYLMQEHPDKRFVILDSNLLYNITSHSLLNVFIEKKNAIYIIEDCEKLLVSRDNEPNPIISAFLNMTDGILANVINCKFICTFNTGLENVDDALKRKGRMKLKYEFKKLSGNKVRNILGDEHDEDMTIADVVYNEKKNDYSEKKHRKIGFNVA